MGRAEVHCRHDATGFDSGRVSDWTERASVGFHAGVGGVDSTDFRLAPALQAARRDLNDPLRDMGRGVIGGFRTARLRDAAVVVEVAVSLTLLVGAGLLMHSFLAMREVNLGLEADHVFKTTLLLPPDRYKTAEQVSAFVRPCWHV